MCKHPARLLAAVLVSAWVVILLMPGDAPAQLYRYTDKDGRIVITDNPPPGVRSDVLDNSDLAPSERETTAAPEAKGPAPMPRPGSRNQALPPMPQPGSRDPVSPSEKQQDAEMKKVADEEIQKAKEEYQRKQQEKQQEKQRRLEEADRLEKEASKPVQPTQENINRQMKLLQEAQRLREMP